MSDLVGNPKHRFSHNEAQIFGNPKYMLYNHSLIQTKLVNHTVKLQRVPSDLQIEDSDKTALEFFPDLKFVIKPWKKSRQTFTSLNIAKKSKLYRQLISVYMGKYCMQFLFFSS